MKQVKVYIWYLGTSLGLLFFVSVKQADIFF